MKLIRNVTILVSLSILLVVSGWAADRARDPSLPPTCDANGPYAGYVGDNMMFDGSGSSDPDGPIVAYDWDFGDGSTGSGVTPTHTYGSPGMYTVTLCVVDDQGNVSCCTTTATVLGHAPICDADGPYEGYAGAAVMFDGSNSHDPYGTLVSYNWDFGDGSTGSGVTPTHSYASEGTYTVVLCVTDDTGNVSCCQTAAIILDSGPVCDADGPYSGCVNGPVTFDGSASYHSNGTIVGYDWDFGDGNTGSGITPTHTYALSGMYTVVLCVTDDAGNVSCCQTTVNISGASAVESMLLGEIKYLLGH